MKNYLEINKRLWDAKTEIHINSDFYNVKEFKASGNSLIGPEVALLGDVKDKNIIHLQCHFGMDSLSLAKKGAQVIGLDLSEKAIEEAQKLASEMGLKAKFICTDVYSAPALIQEKADIILSSYGTIGWLPDMKQWAKVITSLLKPEGRLILAEFHPVIWMYNHSFSAIEYSYFNTDPIIEEEHGTYADRNANIHMKEIGWNHSLDEVISALIDEGLRITSFKEYDYSPYPCFSNLVKIAENKFQIKGMEGKMPMLYTLVAQKLS